MCTRVYVSWGGPVRCGGQRSECVSKGVEIHKYGSAGEGGVGVYVGGRRVG